jgi:tetratricopeptide (TPR) repeat protein
VRFFCAAIGALSLLLRPSAARQDDAADRIAALRSTLASRPSDPAALRGLAAAYAAVGDPSAEQAFQRALAAFPEDVVLRRDHAEFLWRQHRYAEGNAEMERLLARSPDDPELRGRYGELLMEQSRFVQAGTELARACGGDRCAAERLELWASALLETGRFADSARIWRLAIAAEPGRASGYYGLGRLRMLQGDSAAAAVELERAARLDPSAAVLVDYGRALEASGKPEAAEARYREALRVDPQFAAAHYALGTLLARVARVEEARSEIALYQAAFDAAQQSRQRAGARSARLALGWTRLQARDADGALAAFEGMAGDPEGLRGQGEALLLLGRRDEAGRAFERALALAPRDPRIRWALTRARGGDSTP